MSRVPEWKLWGTIGRRVKARGADDTRVSIPHSVAIRWPFCGSGDEARCPREVRMKKLLLQFDPDRNPSAFDRIVAYDAGADEVLSYGGVTASDVTPLVHGAIFTRGPADLRHTAVWVGGTDVGAAEALFTAVQKAFFGPFRVSAMMDANGCNTTAAAAVARLAGVITLSDTRAVILGGTGPVGIRGAARLARGGSTVGLCSRSLDRARTACERLKASFGVTVTPCQAWDETTVKQ